jgi:hypothetical protein
MVPVSPSGRCSERHTSSGQPTVTVATGGEGSHGRDSGGATRATEIRLSPDRDDDATAAYVLRDWMQRL